MPDKNTGTFTGRVEEYAEVRNGRFTMNRLVLHHETEGRDGKKYEDWLEVEVPQSYDGDEPQTGDDVTVEFYIGGNKWQKDENSPVKYFPKLRLRDLRIDSQNRNTGREKATGDPDFGNQSARTSMADNDIPF